jgi:hypothetical protein
MAKSYFIKPLEFSDELYIKEDENSCSSNEDREEIMGI